MFCIFRKYWWQKRGSPTGRLLHGHWQHRQQWQFWQWSIWRQSKSSCIRRQGGRFWRPSCQQLWEHLGWDCHCCPLGHCHHFAYRTGHYKVSSKEYINYQLSILIHCGIIIAHTSIVTLWHGLTKKYFVPWLFSSKVSAVILHFTTFILLLPCK